MRYLSEIQEYTQITKSNLYKYLNTFTHLGILSEIGTDVKKQFPTAAHMCSWAGLVPGQNESAGKRKTAKTKKGNKYLRSELTEAAHSVSASNNYLGAL